MWKESRIRSEPRNYKQLKRISARFECSGGTQAWARGTTPKWVA